MPFQPVNYANIEPQGDSALENLIPLLAQGFKLSQMPRESMDKYQEALSRTELNEAEAQKRRQEAEKQKLLQTFLSQNLGGKGGQGSQAGRGGRGGGLAQTLLNKMALGIEETPEQKQQRELDTFRQKEGFKRQQEQESGEMLTGQSKTEAQKQIQALDSVIPLIDKIKEKTPGKFEYQGRASWNRAKNTALDKLANAIKLGVNVPAIEKLSDILDRGYGESTEGYHKDLSEFVNDLQKQKNLLQKSLKTGKLQTSGSYNNDNMMVKVRDNETGKTLTMTRNEYNNLIKGQ